MILPFQNRKHQPIDPVCTADFLWTCPVWGTFTCVCMHMCAPHVSSNGNKNHLSLPKDSSHHPLHSHAHPAPGDHRHQLSLSSGGCWNTGLKVCSPLRWTAFSQCDGAPRPVQACTHGSLLLLLHRLLVSIPQRTQRLMGTVLRV